MVSIVAHFSPVFMRRARGAATVHARRLRIVEARARAGRGAGRENSPSTAWTRPIRDTAALEPGRLPARELAGPAEEQACADPRLAGRGQDRAGARADISPPGGQGRLGSTADSGASISSRAGTVALRPRMSGTSSAFPEAADRCPPRSTHVRPAAESRSQRARRRAWPLTAAVPQHDRITPSHAGVETAAGTDRADDDRPAMAPTEQAKTLDGEAPARRRRGGLAHVLVIPCDRSSTSSQFILVGGRGGEGRED